MNFSDNGIHSPALRARIGLVPSIQISSGTGTKLFSAIQFGTRWTFVRRKFRIANVPTTPDAMISTTSHIGERPDQTSNDELASTLVHIMAIAA